MAIEHSDLAQLASRAPRVEQCIVEKEQRRSNRVEPRGSQLISVIDYDLAEKDGWQDQPNAQADIMAAKFVQDKPYIYLVLPLPKEKRWPSLKRKLIYLIFPRLINFLITW